MLKLPDHPAALLIFDSCNQLLKHTETVSSTILVLKTFPWWVKKSNKLIVWVLFKNIEGAPPWSSSSVLDHRSLPPMFESQHGHIWRLFHLWLHFITFRGCSAHFAYHVHKSGRKTPIIIIMNIEQHNCFKVSLWYPCINLMAYSRVDDSNSFIKTMDTWNVHPCSTCSEI